MYRHEHICRHIHIASCLPYNCKAPVKTYEGSKEFSNSDTFRQSSQRHDAARCTSRAPREWYNSLFRQNPNSSQLLCLGKREQVVGGVKQIYWREHSSGDRRQAVAAWHAGNWDKHFCWLSMVLLSSCALTQGSVRAWWRCVLSPRHEWGWQARWVRRKEEESTETMGGQIR